MTIPPYEELTVPILKFLSDQKVHSVKDVVKHIIEYFNLSDEEINKLLPSGSGPIINNRVRWAKYYLKKGGLLEIPTKGHLVITPKGIDIIKKNPDGIKITSDAQSQDSLKIKYSKKKQGSATQEVIPDELEKDEIQTKDRENVLFKEDEEKETPTSDKFTNINENFDKREIQTLYKLDSIIENIEKKEIQTTEKLKSIVDNIEKKEMKTSLKLDNIIENIEKKEIQTLNKLDNITRNVEKKLIHTLEKFNNVNKKVEKSESEPLEEEREEENIINNEEPLGFQIPEELDSTAEAIQTNENLEPDQLIQMGYKSIRANMGQEILEKLKKGTIQFFEQIVLQLLSNMGYGKGEVVNRSIDGRIDGFINPDRLGFDRIYFRAYKFKDNAIITASMISDFVGTLELNGANKGVCITTSTFQKNFEQDLQNINKIIILIDGNKLGELMVEYDVGVKTENVYKIKKIDSDFFLNKL